MPCRPAPPLTPLLGAVVFAALAAAPALAQAPAGELPQGRLGRSEMVVSTAPGYYVFHEPGEATVQIAVEGAVRNPGLYEVAVGTDLGRLLALAGGPAYDARQPDVEQRVEVRLFRPTRGVIYATTLQDVLGNPDPYPVLLEGDALAVDVVSSRPFTWRDGLAVAGAVSAVAFLIDVLAGGR